MRWFRPLVIAISLILIILLIMGFIAPKEFRIEKEIRIDAPRSIVFKKVASLESMMEWMPMTRLDPNVDIEYSGTTGTVGSSMTWVGDKNVGAGERTIKSITPLIMVETYIRFNEPWEAVSTSIIQLEQEDDATIMQWEYIGKNPFPFNILQLFLKFDRDMADEFDFSLDNLKRACEQEYLEEKYRGYKIEEVELTERNYLGLRDTLLMDSLQPFFSKSYQKLDTLLAENEIEKAGPRCGLFFLWDEESRLTIAAAAYPVAREVTLDSLENYLINPSPALMINHYGTSKMIESAHLAMETYLSEFDLRSRFPVIEEYVSEPRTSTDSTQWLIRVIYPLVENVDEEPQ